MDAESPYLARADAGLIPSTARPRVAIDEDNVTNFLRSVMVSKLRFFVLGLTEKKFAKSSRTSSYFLRRRNPQSHCTPWDKEKVE